MSIGVRLSSGGFTSNIARKPPIDCNGRADGVSIVPRETMTTGSTSVLFASAASSPPAKSIESPREVTPLLADDAADSRARRNCLPERRRGR